MSFTQQYTAQPGDVITAARWNNEFGNIYDSALSTTSAITAEGGTSGRTLSNHLGDRLSVKDFGAVGDGVTNDYAAIQAGLTYISANGGTLYFPTGVYKVNTALSVTSALAPFSLVGDGPENTTLERGATSIGNLLTFNNCDSVRLENMTIDGKSATYSGGGQAVVFLDCNHCYGGHLFITDYVNSAILDYQTTDGTASHGDNTYENIQVDGLGTASAGILSANAYRNRYINCVVKNIDTAGNPGYAIQFKNNCYDCVMINPMVYTARMGIVISHDDLSANESTNNRVYGGYAYNCALTGLDIARTTYGGFYNIKIDMNNQGNDACSVVEEANYNDIVISTQNVVSSKASVKFDATVLQNQVRITSMANPTSGVSNWAAIVTSGATDNSVTLDKFLNPAVSATSSLFSNAGDSTNTFECTTMPVRELATIAAGAITVEQYKTRFIVLDTSGGAAEDITTINGGRNYQIITITSANNGRDPTLKHNTGNIVLTGSADFTLSNTADTITLMYLSGISKWVEVGRGDNL